MTVDGNAMNDQDNWVVAHIHFDHTNPNLFIRDAAGQVFIGTQAMRLFHGQRTVQPNYAYANPRVGGDDTQPRVDPAVRNGMRYANSRSPLFNCPTPATTTAPEQLFYLGYNNPNVALPQPPAMLTFSAALQAWAATLWRNNILNSYGLSYVFAQTGTSINGPADQFRIGPTIPRPVPFVIPGRATSGRDDPINFNFIWDPVTNTWSYVQNP